MCRLRIQSEVGRGDICLMVVVSWGAPGAPAHAGKVACWTSGRIQTETYGFDRQKTRCWYTNLILISCMSFLVDF